MATLSFKNDDGMECSVEVSAEQPLVLIGRAKNCLIRTSNGTVSRRHCQVLWDEGRYSISDLGSSNGTFYKGERVERKELSSGDEFFCGNFRVTLLVSGVSDQIDVGDFSATEAPAPWADEPADDSPEGATQEERPTPPEDILLLQEQLEVARNERRIAVQDAHAVNQQVAELRVKLETLESELSFAREGAERMKAEVEASGAEVASKLQAEVDALKDELALVKSERVSADEAFEEAQRESEQRFEAAQRQLEGLQAELSEAQARESQEAEDKQVQEAEVQQRLSEVSAEKAELEASHSQALDEVKQLKEALVETERKHDELTEAHRLSQEALTGVEASNEELQAHVQSLKADNEQLTRELDVAPEPGAVAKLEETLALRDEREVELRAELTRLSAELAERTEEANSLSSGAEQTRTTLSEREAEVARLGAELAELKALLMDSATAEEVASLREEAERHKQAVLELEAKRQLDAEEASSLGAKLEAQEASIAELESEKESVESARDELSVRLEASEASLQEATAVLDELRSQSSQAERDLADELGQAKARSASAEEARAKLEASLEELENAVSSKSAELDLMQERLKVQSESSESTLRELQAELEASQTLAAATQSQLASLESRLAEGAASSEAAFAKVSAELATSEAAAEALQGELESAQRRLEEQSEASDSALGELRAELESSQTMVAQAQARATEMETRLSEGVASSESAHAEAELALAASASTIESLKGQLADANTQVASTASKLESAVAEQDILRERCEAAEQEVEQTKAVLDELRSQSGQAERDLADELGQAKSRATKAERLQAKAEEALEALQAESDTYAQELEALRQSLNERDEALVQSESERTDVTARLKSASSEVEVLKGELEAAMGARREVESLNASLEKRLNQGAEASTEALSEADARAEAATGALAKAEARTEALTQQLEALTKDRDDRARELEEHRQANDALKSELAAMTKTLEERLTESQVSDLLQRVETAEKRCAELEQMDDSAGEDGEFREDLLSHMEDVNDLASGWRNDVTLVADYVVDIEADAFEDDAGRDDAMEGLKETLEALGETSREMKAKLREIRDFLEA